MGRTKHKPSSLCFTLGGKFFSYGTPFERWGSARSTIKYDIHIFKKDFCLWQKNRLFYETEKFL